MSPEIRGERRWQVLIVVLAALGLDQATKFAVEKLTPVGSHRVLIPRMLNLVHTTNPGVAFGMFAGSRSPWMSPMLIVFSVAVIGFLVWLLATRRAGGRRGEFGIALILGGAAGNVLDRVTRRSVTDFIDFHVGAHHWYTFNVADSAIVIGACFVILELVADWGTASRQKA